MTTTTKSCPRRSRKNLSTALACLMALGSTSLSTLAQGQAPAPELMTIVATDWEKSESLAAASLAAVEGLAVEIRSDLLSRGERRLAFQDFDGRTYEAELERIERPMDGATTWHGRVSEFGEHSQVLLTTVDGAVSGFFDTPEGRYEIMPRPGGHVLVKLDASRFAGCATEDGEEHDHPVSRQTFDRAAKSLGVDPAAVRQQAEKANALIEIAVMTTATSTSASGGAPGALSTAISAISTLDSAFASSGVSATARYVGWTLVSSDDLGDSSGGGDGLVNTIYSNGSGLNKSNDQQWHQANADLGDTAHSGDGFGEVLASGDFDGDGYDDLAIGIPGEDVDGVSNVGAVQILYGTSSRLSSTGTDFYHQDSPGVDGGNQSGDQFGFALAVGDFDGDGYDDLAIGKPFEDLGGDNNTGRVQVMYGSSGGVSTSGETTLDQDTLSNGTNEDGDKFGYALAAGDFDGDGYDDLAIGIPEEDWSGDSNAGRVAVAYGTSSGLSQTGDQLFDQDTAGVANSSEGGDRFGRSLAAGDFDGDGYDDLVIGAPYENTGGKDDAGVIHALFGSSSGLSGIGSQYFNQGNVGGGTEKNDYFGYSLAVGDINGDGYDDLVVSAPWEDSEVGRVHLLRGYALGLVNSGYYFTGGSSDGRMGLGLAVGDFNDDGYDDIAMGKPGMDVDDENSAGQVVIYNGSTTVPTYDSAWTQASSGIGGDPEASDEMGYALAAGDFDGDGDIDLAVGAPGEGVSNESGYFKTWLGSSSLPSTVRTAFSADLVGLIVENLDDACGSAQTVLGSTDGDSSKFYQVTDRGCAIGNLTFAHEMGHLIGLAHDPANAGSSGACSDANGHFVDGKGRTLMSYSNQCTNDNCTRVAQISNPSINFSFGNPSGISGSRDNARCANLSVGNVAAYN